ncbi:MAG TPA: glycosyltransferase [Myxococcota bacterium]
MHVRVVVPAKNEARSLPALLDSVHAAIAVARAEHPDWAIDVVVVAHRCVDDTAAVARDRGAVVVVCDVAGGKVEALRAGLNDADCFVCIDADVVVGPRTIRDLVTALLASSSTLATCPPLAVPGAPAKWTPLAWALWRYNRARGFSKERLWLSGRCYAVRHVTFPTITEMTKRAETAGVLAGPLLADDIWLSRALLAQGDDAIVHVDTDPVVFRPPATFSGMARTWRRLRRELRRIDVLFPELPSPGRDRRIDMRGRPLADHVALAIFRAALRLVRWQGRFFDDDDEDEAWPVIAESKVP